MRVFAILEVGIIMDFFFFEMMALIIMVVVGKGSLVFFYCFQIIDSLVVFFTTIKTLALTFQDKNILNILLVLFAMTYQQRLFNLSISKKG